MKTSEEGHMTCLNNPVGCEVVARVGDIWPSYRLASFKPFGASQRRIPEIESS